MFNVQLSARLGEILGTKCATVVGQQSIDVHPERLVIGHDFARDYSLDGAVALTPKTPPSAYADCGTAEGSRRTGMRLSTVRSGPARSTRFPAPAFQDHGSECLAYAWYDGWLGPRWNGHRLPSGDEGRGDEGALQDRTASMCQSGVATQPLEERRARFECYDIRLGRCKASVPDVLG